MPSRHATRSSTNLPINSATSPARGLWIGSITWRSATTDSPDLDRRIGGRRLSSPSRQADKPSGDIRWACFRPSSSTAAAPGSPSAAIRRRRLHRRCRRRSGCRRSTPSKSLARAAACIGTLSLDDHVDAELWLVERHGYDQFGSIANSPQQIAAAARHLDAFRHRQRSFSELEAGFRRSRQAVRRRRRRYRRRLGLRPVLHRRARVLA